MTRTPSGKDQIAGAGWRGQRAAQFTLAVVLLMVGGASLERSLRGRFDFHHFYLDARYVWEHQQLNNNFDTGPADTQRQLPFYLPVVPLVLSLVTAFGRTPAAALWTVAQVAALAYSLRALHRWGRAETPLPSPLDSESADDAAGREYVPLLIAILLSLFALYCAAKFNQLSYFVLALVLAGVTALDRGRPRTAGAIFAAAAVLKLLPAIFLPWLLLKRQWTAAAAFVVTAAILIVVPPLAAFGPQRTLEYHRQWWQHNVRGDAARGLVNTELADHFIDHRNQSIGQVVAHWAWTGHKFRTPWQIASFDESTCTRIAYGITVLLLAALVWATRRPWTRLTIEARHGEAAAFAIGMLVFSPLLREYYLVWALPALVLLGKAFLTPASRGVRVAAGVGLLCWALAMLAWPFRTARICGVFLLALIIVGGLVLCVTRVVRGRQQVPGGAGR